MKFAPSIKAHQHSEAQFAGQSVAGEKLLRKLHQTIAKITLDFSGRWHFNTCIAAIMDPGERDPGHGGGDGCGLISPTAAIAEVFRNLVLLLAPFAPFLSAELVGGDWAARAWCFRVDWPVADAELARESEAEIPVQVNGKLVVVITVPAESGEALVKATALAHPKVEARIEGKTVVKVIVVPGKLVNLVVR